MQVKKIAIIEGKKFYIKELDKDFHCQHGHIKKGDFNKKITKTSNGKEAIVFSPSFIDLYKKLKRNAQIILLKDIGIIVAETGINKDSTAVDAGAGSGALCCFLANICKRVVSYEIRKDFVKVVKENIKNLGLKNITIKNKDIYKNIEERNVDLITLDMPEAWRAIKNCDKALKIGGFLIAYFPNILQTKRFIDDINKNKNIIYLKTIETIQREWEIREEIARPKFDVLGHTGFLIFARKIK